jgi:hypothetical protein
MSEEQEQENAWLKAQVEKLEKQLATERGKVETLKEMNLGLLKFSERQQGLTDLAMEKIKELTKYT